MFRTRLIALAAVALFAAAMPWSAPAKADRAGYRTFHHYFTQRPRIFAPPMIGGFALGSATYMYSGFNPCYWAYNCVLAEPIVRARY